MVQATEASSWTDEQLAEAASGGDREAFAVLYERYFDQLYDFAFRMLRDHDSAADAVQSTFVGAWARMQARPPLALKPWLYAIVRNAAIDELRRRKKLAFAEGEDEEGERPNLFELVAGPAQPVDPESIALSKELAGLVWRAASSLGPRDYSLLDLHLRRGLSADEMARELGMRRGALYTALSRARAALEDAVSIDLLLRRGREDCEALRALAAKFDSRAHRPVLTRAQRRAVRSHIRACPACQANRRRFGSAAEIFAGLAPTPPLAGVKAKVWERTRGQMEAPAAPGPSFRARSAALVLALALILGAGVVFAAGRIDGGGPAVNAAPRDPDNLRSLSHEPNVASVRDRIEMAWDALDVAKGYSIIWTETASDLPDEEVDLEGSATGVTSGALPQGAWYFVLRTLNRDGRWTSTLRAGPYLIVAAPATPEPTATQTATPEAVATARVVPTPTPRQAATMAPEPTSTAEPPTPAPSPSPTATASATPTATTSPQNEGGQPEQPPMMH